MKKFLGILLIVIAIAGFGSTFWWGMFGGLSGEWLVLLSVAQTIGFFLVAGMGAHIITKQK